MSQSQDSSLPVYCIHLRAKTMLHGDTFDPRGNEYEPDPQCWCQRTMASIGPDDGFVSPDTCQAGRSCFEGWE
jgi:hypothetical protein